MILSANTLSSHATKSSSFLYGDCRAWRKGSNQPDHTMYATTFCDAESMNSVISATAVSCGTLVRRAMYPSNLSSAASMSSKPAKDVKSWSSQYVESSCAVPAQEQPAASAAATHTNQMLYFIIQCLPYTRSSVPVRGDRTRS